MIEAMKAPLISSNEMILPEKGKAESLSLGQVFAQLLSNEGDVEAQATSLAVTEEQTEGEAPSKKNTNLEELVDTKSLKNLDTAEDFISQKVSLKQPADSLVKTILNSQVDLEEQDAPIMKGEENLKSEKINNLLRSFNKTLATDENLVKAKTENIAPSDMKVGSDTTAVKANVFSLSTLIGEKKENVVNEQGSSVKNKDEQPTLAKILDFKSTTINPETAVLETGKPEAIDNKAPTKILDLSSVQITNNTSKTEIIQKIADYIQTNNLVNKSEIELTVKHQDLGTFQINVQKMKGAQDIKMSIATNDQEGFKFFQKFEGELVRTLEGAGIKVADFKVTTSQMNFSSSLAQDSGAKDGQGGRQQWSESSSFREESWQKSSSDERRQDSDRRRDIWAQYRERFGA